MALGAEPGDILCLVVGQGLSWIVMGLTLGFTGAPASSRVLESLLFGVRATDPATFSAVGLALTVVALLATYFPARQAARVDPSLALRFE